MEIKIEIKQEEIRNSLYMINICINDGEPIKYQIREKLSDKKVKELEAYLKRHINNMMMNVIIDFFV